MPLLPSDQSSCVPSSRRHVDWQIVSLVLSLKAFLLLFGGQSYQSISDQRLPSLYSWFELWDRWDAQLYLDIARNGYTAVGERSVEIVFYPLFPRLTSLLAFLVGDALIGAFIVAGVASLATGLLFQRLVQLDYPGEIARSAVWFLFIFPTSYFLHIPYTESLFLALTIACFYAARTERWMLAGVSGMLASACRVNGMVLVPALAVELWSRYRGEKRFRVHWLWLCLLPVGFAVYLLLNYRVAGSPFAFAPILEEHWTKVLTWPWLGIQRKYGTFIDSPSAASSQIVGYQELFFAALGALSTVWCWFRLRPSYGVWMTLNWLLFVSTSWVLSVPRYVLILFPIFIMFGDVGSRHRLIHQLITAWSLCFLALFSALFASGHWAF